MKKRILAGLIAVLMVLSMVAFVAPQVMGEDGPMQVVHATLQSDKKLGVFFNEAAWRNKSPNVGVCLVDGSGNIVTSKTEGNPIELPAYIGNSTYPASPMVVTLNSTAKVTVDGETLTIIPQLFDLVKTGAAYAGATVMLRILETSGSDGKAATKGNNMVDSLYPCDLATPNNIYPARALAADHVASNGFDEAFVPVELPVTVENVWYYNDKEFVLDFSEPVKLVEKYASYIRIVDAATNDMKDSSKDQYNVTCSAGNSTWSALRAYGNNGTDGVSDKWYGIFQNTGHTMTKAYARAAELTQSESKPYVVRFCIEEKKPGDAGGAATVVCNDGFVSSVESLTRPGIYLACNKWGGEGKVDGIYMDITGSPADLSATAVATGEDTVKVTFSAPVGLNNFANYVDNNNWVGVRIYDPEAGNYVTVDKVTYQWRFPLTATDDPCVFTATRLSSASINGIKNLSDIFALVEEGGLFDGLGYEVDFCFQHNKAGTSIYRVGGYVNNIRGNAGGMLPDNDKTGTLVHFIPLSKGDGPTPPAPTPSNITLDDVVYHGWVADLTFSAPVNFVNLANAIRCCHDALAADQSYKQYTPQKCEYFGDVTVKGGKEYSKNVRVWFRPSGSKIDIAQYGANPPAGQGVRLIEFNGGDGKNQLISASNIVGLNGEQVEAKSDTTNDICFKAASSISSLPQFVSAVVTDPASYEVTINFSEPMHLSETGTISVRLNNQYNPGNGGSTPDAKGDWGCTPKSWEYVDPQTIGDKQYSDKIKITFNMVSGYPEMPVVSGVRFMEYNYSADNGNAALPKEVAYSVNGLPLAATVQAGNVDLAWRTITFSGTSAEALTGGVKSVDDRQFSVSFSSPVALNDLSAISASGDGWTADATAAVSESGETEDTSWIITFDTDADMTDAIGKTILGGDSFHDKYGRGIVAAELAFDPWTGSDIEHGTDFSSEFTSGALYNFMNCDTGRSLEIGSTDEWALTKIDGVNMWTLKDSVSGKYVDLTGTSPVLSEYPCKIMLRKCENERYQLIIGASAAVADSDAGTTNAATLCAYDEESRVICTGWYITKSGDTRPLRIMPLGDSLTYGVNPDLATALPRVGYREALSTQFGTYFDRYVFVGSQVTAVTQLNETKLLRHAGYSGYVITDMWQVSGHPGVDVEVPGLKAKYDPDVVLLMLGTNDVSMMVNNSQTESTDLDAEMGRYKAFVELLDAGMDSNDLIICSALTPRKEGANVPAKQQLTADFNAALQSLVVQWAAEGLHVAFHDNNTEVAKMTNMGLSSDGIHLNADGYAKVADLWYATVTGLYTEEGVRSGAVIGDCNGDGVISVDDVVRMRKYLAAYNFNTGTSSIKMDLDAADCNGDGKFSLKDVVRLKKYLAARDPQTGISTVSLGTPQP